MKAFTFLSNLDTLIYVCLTFYSLKNLNRLSNSLRLFLVFLLPTFIIQVWALVLSKMELSNLYLFPISIIIQSFGLGLFYIHFFRRSNFIYGVIPLIFLILCVFLIEFIQKIAILNETLTWKSHYVSSYAFIILAALALLMKIDSQSKGNYTLIHIAILLYFSMSSTIFLFGNMLVSIKPDVQVLIWISNILLHSIFLIIIGISLWKNLS